MLVVFSPHIFPYPKPGMKNQLLTEGEASLGKGWWDSTQSSSSILEPFDPCSSPRSCKGHLPVSISSSARGQPRQAFPCEMFLFLQKKNQTKPQTGIQQSTASQAQTPVLEMCCTSSPQSPFSQRSAPGVMLFSS